MLYTERLPHLHAFLKSKSTLSRKPRSEKSQRTTHKRRTAKHLRKQKVALTPLDESPCNRRPSQASDGDQGKAHPSADSDLGHVSAAQARAGSGKEALHAGSEEAVDDAKAKEAVERGYADPDVEQHSRAEGYGDEGVDWSEQFVCCETADQAAGIPMAFIVRRMVREVSEDTLMIVSPKVLI
jgi:hypothetical protein